MRLSWNEVRARAADFAREWADAAYEKGETHSFYNDFFEIFDVKRRTVARYEEHVRRLDNTRSLRRRKAGPTAQAQPQPEMPLAGPWQTRGGLSRKFPF